MNKDYENIIDVFEPVKQIFSTFIIICIVLGYIMTLKPIN